ncbi:MAG: HAMP domain-containing histidine kinase [Sphingomonadaceae bacterium]|nr:HAMP domain-containing histidine kinase [Sphingomonadaceae bacterium]
MAPDTRLPMANPHSADTRVRKNWPWRMSVTVRILAVNFIALALLAGSLFYIDSYRKELFAERFILATSEVQIAATALDGSQPGEVRERMLRIAAEQGLRLRLYDSEGKLAADSFKLAEPSFSFIDPDSEPWLQHAARLLDSGMDFLLGSPPIAPHIDHDDPGAVQWPEISEAMDSGSTVIVHRLARDQTPVINAATPIGASGAVLLTTRNARDITQNVRDARQTLAIIVGAAFMISILLSLFLARTIVQPLRILVRSAVRVRLGRDREVVVPRLPERRDEIGLLARAISDMAAALRQRIDAVESFAADVSHELKNPLTSLRSAVESLQRVDDPDLRAQLLTIARQDVGRIDRLVTEIADASRIDAQLSRTEFTCVDLFKLVQALVAERESRGVNGSSEIQISQRSDKPMLVSGDGPRLERVLHNLLDNAVSFSPDGELIEIQFERHDDQIVVAISDHGPGIPDEAREKVFERFHSLRPSAEDFGKHSGLGLAIARTIVEAHFGSLTAGARKDSQPGARLIISLPAWLTE